MKKYLVCLLTLAIVLAATRPLAGSGDLGPGEATAEAAAAPDLSGSFGGHYGFVVSDTTGYEFPEEEENQHVWRDVALWTIIAGFVAFFVIKVFLQGDTDDPEPQKPGKEIPPTTLVIPQPAGRSP